MPIYEYESLDKSCDYCRNGFDLIQSMLDDPFTSCPICNKPVRRIISVPNINKKSNDPLSKSNLEAKGFTQYRKEKKGVYKKTVGSGPDRIFR